MQKIYPIIMCGGSGTRMWPLSRKSKAKQYHAIISETTMLQDTILRLVQDDIQSDVIEVAGPSFVCGKNDETVIKEQSRDAGVTPHRIILEPMGRNTAPVAAIIADLIHQDDPDGLILLMPADHHIADKSEFWNCLTRGLPAAQEGYLTTFGIQPTGPETGFGYIQTGSQLFDNVNAVKAFVEKPDLETAKSYLASGDYFWNAGIFLFSPKAMIKAFEAHANDILEASRLAISASKTQDSSLYLDADKFSKVRSESIDYAIMEAANNVVVISPVNVGWNDIGSWLAVRDFAQNEDGNSDASHVGDVIALDCKNSYIRTDGPVVAAIGLEDMVVVAHEGAILIMPADRSQDVKKIVAQLRADERADKL